MTKALRFLAVLLVAFPVFAQAQSQRSHTQAELDQMLAPIALYPDALLSQVLMAATYPLEVVQAARWSRANPGLQGEDAVRAVQDEDWDPSVKSLVAFPQILQRMDEQLDWTRSLGDAFLAQEPQVMDQVQQLRQRAQAAGNLRSDQQIHVEQQGQTIVVQPASPQVVYVPYYDPLVVYGPWWWPAYQPVVWAPWPGYVRSYRPGISVGFWWGGPISLSLNFFFGDFDWHHRHVRVAYAGNHYYRPRVIVNRTVVVERGRWQHDAVHRRGVEYRAPEVRQRFASPQVDRREALREDRRDERRLERRTARRPAQLQAQPAARVREQTQAPAVTERRADRRQQAQAPAVTERRADRREQRQAERVQAQPQPAAQPRAERREKRQASQVQVQPQPVAKPQPQLRQAEQRQSMPAARAPQTPRVERQAERQERREQREERREDRGRRAG